MLAHLLRCVPNPLGGLKIVVDTAHGAAAQVSPEAFRAAGAEVHVIGAEPDGLNINDGYGATHLEMLQAAVVERGADLGIAHDGDAVPAHRRGSHRRDGRWRPDHVRARDRLAGAR